MITEALSVYVKLAVSVATIPKTRAVAVQNIHKGRHGLWETRKLKDDWKAFLSEIASTSDHFQEV